MTDLPDLSAPPPLLLTREAILAGTVRQVALQMPGMVVLSDAELDASIAATLAQQPQPGGDVWIFGYGSLIWNPAFEHDKTQLGKVAGWHRRFCLWTNLSRGCTRQPGLTLGLDRGGACRGMLFRIPRAQAAMELSVLWRREMVGGAYVPRWVKAATPQGAVDAITFTINHAHPRYTGRLDEAEMVRVIACASGTLGRCSEYLFKTEASLVALGIRDRRLEALCRQVEAAIGREA
jgi:glutathione-specific gamma-glutamylcyclotransferase